jgi:hypothetical protein
MASSGLGSASSRKARWFLGNVARLDDTTQISPIGDGRFCPASPPHMSVALT